MLFRRDCKGFECELFWVQIYWRWVAKLFNFFCFNLFTIYCFFYFSYSSIAIYFYSPSLPSLIKIDYWSFTLFLKLYIKRLNRAYASGPEYVVPELFPSPNAITVKLFSLSIVYWASLVICPFILEILVDGVTFGVSRFGSSKIIFDNTFCMRFKHVLESLINLSKKFIHTFDYTWKLILSLRFFNRFSTRL